MCGGILRRAAGRRWWSRRAMMDRRRSSTGRVDMSARGRTTSSRSSRRRCADTAAAPASRSRRGRWGSARPPSAPAPCSATSRSRRFGGVLRSPDGASAFYSRDTRLLIRNMRRRGGHPPFFRCLGRSLGGILARGVLWLDYGRIVRMIP